MGRFSVTFGMHINGQSKRFLSIILVLSCTSLVVTSTQSSEGVLTAERNNDQESEQSGDRQIQPFNLIAPRPSMLQNQATSSHSVRSILNGVEAEPGIVMPSVPPTSTASVFSEGTLSEESGPTLVSGRMMAHLQRITERLSSIDSLQVQTLRKLEGLDYRLTRVEVQMQERGETVRNLVTDTSRRLQQLESDVGRIETLLDLVRDESTAIRASQSELKHILTQSGGQPTPARSLSETDVPAPRLQVLLAGMNSLRASTNGMRDELASISKNITSLSNITKNFERRSDDLVTKQDLHRGISDLKSRDSVPATSLSHFTHSSLSCPSSASTERSSLPKDCHEAFTNGGKQSGIQRIQPLSSSAAFFVQCDMETRGGGWTVIQNRFDGSVSFLRGWSDYKHGFGNMATEFWLGLEKIHMITNQGVYELLVELTDFGLNQATAHYTAFAIGSDAEGYDIRLLGTYEGDAGDSLSYHTSMKFSTPDNDQDQWLDGNCARDHTGGWWYRGCDTSNLNGQYLNGPVPLEFEYKGMYWYDYQGPMYSLMKSKMMIRPFSNAIGSVPSSSGTTVKPRPAQVPPPPGNPSRSTLGPKLTQQGQMKLKKKKETE